QYQRLMVMPSGVLKPAEIFELLVAVVPFLQTLLGHHICFYGVIRPDIEFNRASRWHAVSNSCILIWAYDRSCHLFLLRIFLIIFVFLFRLFCSLGVWLFNHSLVRLLQFDPKCFSDSFQEHSDSAVEEWNENQKANFPIIVQHFESDFDSLLSFFRVASAPGPM